MSDKTPEKVKNTEIWEFKNPEELANALEQKSKTDLANKIRSISWKVQDNSIDLRKALQEELSDTEQKEIRETLKDSWVAKVFTKWMSQEEKAMQAVENEASEIIWEENAKTLKKVEWIWNRLSTWFDKIWDIFSEKWMMAWIWAIILMFKWIFSWDFSALDNILNPKKEEKKDEDKKGSEKIDENNMLNMKVFIEYVYKWEDKSEILNICQKWNFKKLSFKEIKEISNDDTKLNSWIKETYWDTRVNKSQIKTAFKLFIDWKWNETFQRILAKNYNENLKINEAFKSISKDLFIFEHISSLNPNDLLKEWWEMVRFDIADFKDWEPPKIFNERWITKNLWTFILSSSYWVWDNIEKLLSNSPLENKEKEKLREMITFWEKIQSEIILNNKINLWMWEKIKKTFAEKPLSLIEITKMYIILWWETDFSQMNEFKQSFMYFSVWSLLDKNRSNWTQWEYIVKLADLIKDWISWKASEIPTWVTDFMWSVWNWLIDYIEKSLIDWWVTFAWWFKEVIKKYPWLLAILVWIILIYPFAQRRSILWVILPKFWWRMK